MIATTSSSPAQPQDTGSEPCRRAASRREVWLGAVLVVLALGSLLEAKLWRPETRFTIRENVQIGEAEAWWSGRLDLPERKWDTAVRDGRAYSHFPPMFSFMAAAVVPFFQGVPHWLVVLVIVLPVPLLAYALFYLRTGSAAWGSLLAIGMVVGTSLFPVIDKTLRGASPYYVNQTLATAGVLIVLIESFGRRRVWLAGLGLLVAGLSRQMTIAYALPLAWLAFEARPGHQRRSRVAGLATVCVLIAAVYCVLNTLKFGHPLDTGYMRIYADRPADSLSRDAQAYGLFSAHYVPRNLYYANLGFPRVHRIEVEGRQEIHVRPNRLGTGIWWTTPLLLLLFADFRRILSNPLERVWLVAAVAVAVTLLFYVNTGAQQRGFNRFSLDYIPVILALVAPGCTAGWRRWASMAAIVWSIVYFCWLI